MGCLGNTGENNSCAAARRKERRERSKDFSLCAEFIWRGRRREDRCSAKRDRSRANRANRTNSANSWLCKTQKSLLLLASLSSSSKQTRLMMSSQDDKHMIGRDWISLWEYDLTFTSTEAFFLSIQFNPVHFISFHFYYHLRLKPIPGGFDLI